jgi:hypothetical protein
MPHPVVFSRALEKKVGPGERGETAVEKLMKLKETPVSGSSHTGMDFRKNQLIGATLLLSPAANIRSDGGPRIMRERKIQLVAGLVPASHDATKLLNEPINHMKEGAVIIGVSKHSLTPYEFPSLLLSADEKGHAYDGVTYKVAFSANTTAGGVASFDTELSPRTLNSVNGAGLVGRTVVAILTQGEQNSHGMPYVLVFEKGREFKEIENYAKPWLTEHPNILLVTFGLFSDVVLQKQEPGKHVLIQHGQKHETEAVATTRLKASGPVPGLTVTDLRANGSNHSWSTYAAFDNNGTMQGGALLSAKVEGKNTFGIVYFG